MTSVPHLPWAPQEAIRGLPPMGSFAPPLQGDYHFWREPISMSFTVFVLCFPCATEHQAGASAGERKLIRWARDHVCNAPQAEFVADEDTNLFRK